MRDELASGFDVVGFRRWGAQLARVPHAAARGGTEAGCCESPLCAKATRESSAKFIGRPSQRSSASTCTPSSSSTAATAAIGKT